MRRLVTLAEAAGAAEELASELLGFSVRKAVDPLSPAGYLLISEAVAKRLAKAAAGAEAEVLADIIDELGFDWADLSVAAATAAMKAVNAAIVTSYGERLLPRLADILLVEGPRVMKNTRSAMIAREHIELGASLSQRDLKAEESIRTSQVNFIRDSSGVRAAEMSEKARELVANAVGKGIGTDKIGLELQAYFTDEIPRPDSYWRVVADSFVNRARTFSQIYAYQEAEVQTFELVAVLDEVTTDICRALDGTIFEVSAAAKLMDSIVEMDDPEDIKYAQPWVRTGRDDDGQKRLFVAHADGTSTTLMTIDRSGVGKLDDRGEYSNRLNESQLVSLGVLIPPFHGRCRTTLVAGEE